MLHPIVIPTIGVMLYLLLIPNNYASKQKTAFISLVFVTTYLIPLFILIVLKKLKLIKTYQTKSIKERKIPVAIMIVLFYLLGNTFSNISLIRDLSLLFYATCLGLLCIYALFLFKIKTSIHLLSLGISIGFFIVLGFIHNTQFSFITIVSILLAGITANARLYLNAHNTAEIYIGFFIGFFAPFSIYYFL